MTATSVAFMPSIDAEVRWTMAWTWSGVSVTPLSVLMKTDAVGSAFCEVKTVSLGIANCTDAIFTPLRAWIVEASSPSIARL